MRVVSVCGCLWHLFDNGRSRPRGGKTYVEDGFEDEDDGIDNGHYAIADGGEYAFDLSRRGMSVDAQ